MKKLFQASVRYHNEVEDKPDEITVDVLAVDYIKAIVMIEEEFKDHFINIIFITVSDNILIK